MNNKQRLEIHEKVFHNISLALWLNNEDLLKILKLISAWSYAINGSNGQATELEIKRKQDSILKMLEGS